MKRILFMMPSYYNFNDVVAEGLKKHSSFHINSIDTVGNQVYRHIFDRIINFLSKVFLNKNLKPEMKRTLFSKLIDKYDSYNYLIVNRPDIITPETLNKALSKSQKSILLLWDSLEKIPLSFEIINKFDVIYSFDSYDCNTHNFRKIENFHFFDTIKFLNKPTHQVTFIGTLDTRIDGLKNILNYFREQNKSAKAYIFVPSGKSMKKHRDIEILKEIVPFKESYKYALTGEIILDIAHENQRGLSFRVFEAMAFNKKLITTNTYIKNYDFYNSQNIFVIDDVNHINIAPSFWESPYQPLSTAIIEKYHIKNWVRRILNDE